MMTALAQVVLLDETKQGQVAHLSCDQQTSCNSCKSQKSCGSGIATKALVNKSHQWRLQTKERLAVGDLVEIGLSEKYLVQSALIVYLLPLLVMFVGVMLASALGISELGQIIGFIGSGFIGFYIAKRIAKHFEQKTKQDVVLIRVLGQAIATQ